VRVAVVDCEGGGKRMADSGVGLSSSEVERRIVEAFAVDADGSATVAMKTKTTRTKMRMIERTGDCGRRFVECFPIPRTGPLNLSRTRKP
jgi:hypothetical protein